jgi:CMP-N-acetylneuraminic acid synthetase
MKDFTILIPARRNSKGLPFKNRRLLANTIDSIPQEFWGKIIVNTDDEFIIDECIGLGIQFYKRPEIYATDSASTKSVINNMIDSNTLSGNVIMLYLTYPQRTWLEVIEAYDIFLETGSKSLLCKKDIGATHPYLYMYDIGDNKGKQIVNHDLYRRQDYPIVFEISHYISIFNTSELSHLNNNLYNDDTFFFHIQDKIDIDYESDMFRFIKS